MSRGSHEVKPLAIENVLMRHSAAVTTKLKGRRNEHAVQRDAVTVASGRRKTIWKPQSIFSHCKGEKMRIFAPRRSQ